jgi:hypothetical protein
MLCYLMPMNYGCPVQNSFGSGASKSSAVWIAPGCSPGTRLATPSSGSRARGMPPPSQSPRPPPPRGRAVRRTGPAGHVLRPEGLHRLGQQRVLQPRRDSHRHRQRGIAQPRRGKGVGGADRKGNADPPGSQGPGDQRVFQPGRGATGHRRGRDRLGGAGVWWQCARLSGRQREHDATASPQTGAPVPADGREQLVRGRQPGSSMVSTPRPG